MQDHPAQSNFFHKSKSAHLSLFEMTPKRMANDRLDWQKDYLDLPFTLPLLGIWRWGWSLSPPSSFNLRLFSPKQQITSCYSLFCPATILILGVFVLISQFLVLHDFSLFVLQTLRPLVCGQSSIFEVKWVLLGQMRCLRVWILSTVLGFCWFSKFDFRRQLTSLYWGRLETRRPNRLWRHPQSLCLSCSLRYTLPAQ